MTIALWALWAIAYTGFVLHGALAWHDWRNGQAHLAWQGARDAYLYGLAATALGGLAVVTS